MQDLIDAVKALVAERDEIMANIARIDAMVAHLNALTAVQVSVDVEVAGYKATGMRTDRVKFIETLGKMRADGVSRITAIDAKLAKLRTELGI